MPSGDQASNTFKSDCPSTPTRSRYSSPLPSKPASPPPLPRARTESTADGSEVDAESVLKEINSGHSILNRPKPVGTFSRRSVRRPRSRSDSTLAAMLAAPSRLSSLSSGDSGIYYNGGPIRLQMRSAPRRGRSPKPRSPTTVSGLAPIKPEADDDEELQIQFQDLYISASVSGFVPIKPEDRDDEGSQDEVRTLAH